MSIPLLSVLFFLATPAKPAMAQQASGLHVVETKVTAHLKGGTATQIVTVVNDGIETLPVQFEALIGDEDVTISPATLDLAPHSVTQVLLKFTSPKPDEDLAGTLIVTGSSPPGVVPLEILADRELATPAKTIVIVTLLVAIAFVIIRWWTLKLEHERVGLNRHMGPVGWKFSDSWASNLTAVGAILGAIAGTSLLPDRRTYVSKDWLTTLNMFFGALTVVAPFVFAATRVAKKPYPSGDKEPEYLGIVFWFLVSGGITFWAVLGELATIGLFVAEAQKVLATPVVAVIAGLLVVSLVILLFRYCWTTMERTVIAQIEQRSKDLRRRTARGEALIAALAPTESKDAREREVDRQLLPAWSVM
jgi:hypothetical protein